MLFFVGVIQWLGTRRMAMNVVKYMFHTSQKDIGACRKICESKSVSHGCWGFNRHGRLGCYYHNSTPTTTPAGFWTGDGWSIYYMSCIFGELGYPGVSYTTFLSVCLSLSLTLTLTLTLSLSPTLSIYVLKNTMLLRDMIPDNPREVMSNCSVDCWSLLATDFPADVWLT